MGKLEEIWKKKREDGWRRDEDAQKDKEMSHEWKRHSNKVSSEEEL